MKITKTRIDYLQDFFSYNRPHNSGTERDFINRYILPLVDYHQGLIDQAGNLHLDLRTAPAHRTLFVAHTDTVHHAPGRQGTAYNKATGTLSTRGQVLGADDGAGILVLLHLIQNNVPGYYIFTRGEERGGIGARFLADRYPDLLLGFDRAIAFDRRGTSSVITHQSYGRTCSDLFADTLSDFLSGPDLMYAPDDSGVYTDTAEFLDLIPECTNISVGYFKEHTRDETLSVPHLFALLDQVLVVPWDALPVARDPLGNPDTWDAWPGDMAPWRTDTMARA